MNTPANPVDINDLSESLRFSIKHLLCVSELLVDREGLTRASNFILSAHFILNEIINILVQKELDLMQKRMSEKANKSCTDYLAKLEVETQWRDENAGITQTQKEASSNLSEVGV